jgi:hypothetical protein
VGAAVARSLAARVDSAQRAVAALQPAALAADVAAAELAAAAQPASGTGTA